MMICTRLASGLLAAALASVLLTPRVHAAEPAAEDTRAKELYDNGVILYDEGRYEDAIAAWQEAYRLSGRPLLLFNMANALERIGRYQEAMDDLSRYRAFAAAEERETLDRRIRNLEARMDESRAAAATLPPAPTTASTPSTTTAPTTTDAPASTAGSVRVLPIVLGAVGAVGVGTGTYFGLAALDARAAADEGCVTNDAGTWCSDAAADALARDKQSSLLADVGFGVGGLAIAGAVITAVLPGKTTGLELGTLPGGGWLRLGGTF